MSLGQPAEGSLYSRRPQFREVNTLERLGVRGPLREKYFRVSLNPSLIPSDGWPIDSTKATNLIEAIDMPLANISSVICRAPSHVAVRAFSGCAAPLTSPVDRASQPHSSWRVWGRQ